MSIELLVKLLQSYPLNEDESYNMYVLRDDRWPWGFLGEYSDIESLIGAYINALDIKDMLGIWITKEANNGTSDVTIMKYAFKRGA